MRLFRHFVLRNDKCFCRGVINHARLFGFDKSNPYNLTYDDTLEALAVSLRTVLS